jgi:hypothetical protein
LLIATTTERLEEGEMIGLEKFRAGFFVALLAVLAPLVAHSDPILQVSSDGQLTGATGVDVDGTLWDVVFSDGEWDYSSGTGLPASTKEEADLFSQALLDQVLLDSSLGQFDTDPETAIGCFNLNVCIFYTPYFVDDVNTYFSLAFNQSPSTTLEDFVRDVPGILGLTGDFGDATNWTLGVWTLSSTEPPTDPPTSVPEPGTLALLGIGLFGMGLARRRKV